MNKLKTLNALMGLCVGDALGVPVEFIPRNRLQQNLVTDMMAYGTHNQPAGTWSDDSSLAFCLAESLCKEYDLQDIAKKFVSWYKDALWTPHGRVFDIGIATSKALHKLNQGVSPLLSGGRVESDNGNGSLMRILPLIFYIKDMPIIERFKMVNEVSGITHAHIRSVLACFIYCEYALLLLAGKEKTEAYTQMQQTVNQFMQNSPVATIQEQTLFDRILQENIKHCTIDNIYSSGYVVSTLEASFWCFLNTENYTDAVLKAVNLGEDTDTTGCVTGGLAGLYYGLEAIPIDWRNAIVKKEAIEKLADTLANYQISV